MRATMNYTLLRALIFLVALVVLALFGMHGITLLIAALFVSAIISLPLLSRVRDRMSASVTRRVDKFQAGLDQGTKAEDAD